jgi:transposase
VSCRDTTASRHFQAIWHLARGHTVTQVAAATAFGERWIEQLLARYNAEGPDTLGDLRRYNGASATVLKPELLAKLRDRLREPPPDGGMWSSRKVANWPGNLRGVSVAPQRGWRAESRVPGQSEAFRGGLLDHHPQKNPARRVQICRRSQRSHQPLHQGPKQNLQALRMDRLGPRDLQKSSIKLLNLPNESVHSPSRLPAKRMLQLFPQCRIWFYLIGINFSLH